MRDRRTECWSWRRVRCVAAAILEEIDHWLAYDPETKLILNLSIGWDGEYKDLDAKSEAELETSTKAVYDALQYARDMDTALADRFVGMYVNEWTLDYGPRGREAVQRLLTEGHRAGIIPHAVTVTFAE